MPKRTKLEGPATPEQIDAALKTHTQPHQQKRLVAVGMASKANGPAAKSQKHLAREDRPSTAGLPPTGPVASRHCCDEDISASDPP